MSFRFSIRTKLVGIITIILLTAAVVIVGFATDLFSKDNVAKVQEMNLVTAGLLAQEIKNDITNLTEKMRVLGISLMQPLTPSQLEAVQRPFFEREKDLLAESVFAVAGSKARLAGRAANDSLLKTIDVPLEDVVRLHQAIPADKLSASRESVVTGQLKGNIPVLTVVLPLMTDDAGNVTHSVVATLKQDRFLRAVTHGNQDVDEERDIVSYLVDSQGYVLAHPRQERVLKHENLSHLEIVKRLLSGQNNNGLVTYVDPVTQVEYIAAFQTLGFSGIGVVSQQPAAMAYKAARKVKNASMIITAMVAVVAFVVIFFFSLSLTQPIFRLVEATDQVAKGNYEVHLAQGANDEIGDLTAHFSHMAQGLAEREKIKNAFSKFHSKDIADKILSGSLSLTGERKKVTVFFSDIRSFTSISEKLQPEQVVELVNSYMTRMVRIIFAHGGVVDKYVGDAIMAVYGTPVAHEDDSLRAVSAALRMRAELKRFNEAQQAAGKPVIAIGMGMHTGDVVAGNIGSPERMEYTILGDNVNLTSRMESLTKEFKTDILVSWATYEEIKDRIICQARGTTKVKGKAEEVAVYEVIDFKPGQEYVPAETGHTGETSGRSSPPPPRKEMTNPGLAARPRAASGAGAGLASPPPPRKEMTNPELAARPRPVPLAEPAPPAEPSSGSVTIELPVLEDPKKKAA